MTPTPPSQHPQNPPIASPAALALLPFEAALFVVSNYLAEARIATETHQSSRAQNWYDAAEACALQTGYVELIQLVWSDVQNDIPPKSSFGHPPSFGAAASLR